MKYYATKTQRFFAYLIDILIIGFASGFILDFVFWACNYNTSTKDSMLQQIYEELANWIRYSAVDEKYNLNDMMTAIWEYMKYYLFEWGIKAIILLVLCSLYFVLLPMFWEKQTIGRTALNVRVIRKDGEKITWKSQILRELIGTFLLYEILGVTGVFIATLVLVSYSGRSVVDYVGGTILVPVSYINELKAEKKVEEPRSDYYEPLIDSSNYSDSSDNELSSSHDSSSDDHELY